MREIRIHIVSDSIFRATEEEQITAPPKFIDLGLNFRSCLRDDPHYYKVALQAKRRRVQGAGNLYKDKESSLANWRGTPPKLIDFAVVLLATTFTTTRLSFWQTMGEFRWGEASGRRAPDNLVFGKGRSRPRIIAVSFEVVTEGNWKMLAKTLWVRWPEGMANTVVIFPVPYYLKRSKGRVGARRN